MLTRRNFIAGAAVLGASAVSRAAMASVPEAPTQSSAATQPPLAPPNGRPYQPVVTLNGWTLPWRMRDGWKEFHLVAEPVVREMAPGMKANLWGYNGQSPGPTIECVEGDRVRIFVTNRLPEHTTIHWHGILLPSGMDGVGGLTQTQIPVGQDLRLRVHDEEVRARSCTTRTPTRWCRWRWDMMGFIVVHPKNPGFMRVDRDFVFLINAYDIEPGARTPRVNTMLDFNLWTWNSRVFPGIDHLAVRRGDKVRIRMGNLTMTNHPIHMHGYDFKVTGTDGGWVRPEAQWPEVTIDVPVGAMRAFEFDAVEPGDWAFHCHKSHHTMNAMGHNVPTMIGVDHRGVAPEDHEPRAGLHGDGRARHGRHGRDGDAAPRQHAADDDRAGTVRRRSRWAGCSPWSRCGKASRGTITRTRAGTSTRRGPSPTSGRASRRRSRARRMRRSPTPGP